MGLKSNDWENIKNLVNSYFPDFELQLHNLCKISETEYNICLLIKCGFSPTEISLLTNMSKSGLGNLRKRLLKKALKTDGSATDWDKFIVSLQP